MGKRSIGIFSGVTSYVLWGILGIFWALLQNVSAMDILAYRFVFSLVFMSIILTIQKDWRSFYTSIKELCVSGKIIWVIISAFLIAINWGTYIYMVGHGQATEASLGYYIMPLLNIVIAVVFFKESVNKYSILAIILATLGVILFAIQAGSLPLNTMIIALAFCSYGVLKKKIDLPASFSLTLETIVCLPVGLLYLLLGSTESFFSYDSMTIFLLVASGIVTAIPLLLFTVAAKNVDFLTLSFIQYINPTMQLVVAVFWLHEAFDVKKLAVFSLIWAGVIVFTLGSVRNYRQLAKLQRKQIASKK